MLLLILLRLVRVDLEDTLNPTSQDVRPREPSVRARFSRMRSPVAVQCVELRKLERRHTNKQKRGKRRTCQGSVDEPTFEEERAH